uniref:Uncharacterized protein n=1 Tax=Pinguiococcus pyrenoidosus TaxID=172671 RepID=A0A7R9UF28_9STRA|mmetsp:Transcript_8270/g.31097  ORF Transcript_8270/g.31097 Transcript_8270/m.31097 type:complete len:397 (+) Transcript_8270:29-1219(+)
MAPRRIFVEVHGEAGRVTRQLMELWSGSEVLRATDVAQKIAGSADRDASVSREVVEVSVEGFAVSSESCGSVFRDGDRVTIRLGRALSPLRAQESTRAAPSPSRRLPKASGERKAKVSTLEALTHLKEASSKSPAERRKRKKRGREVVLAQVHDFFEKWPASAATEIRSGDVILCRPPASAEASGLGDVESVERLRLAVLVRVDPDTGSATLVPPSVSQRQQALQVRALFSLPSLFVPSIFSILSILSSGCSTPTGFVHVPTLTGPLVSLHCQVVSKWQTLRGIHTGVPSLPVSLEQAVELAAFTASQDLKVVSRLPHQVRRLQRGRSTAAPQSFSGKLLANRFWARRRWLPSGTGLRMTFWRCSTRSERRWGMDGHRIGSQAPDIRGSGHLGLVL